MIYCMHLQLTANGFGSTQSSDPATEEAPVEVKRRPINWNLIRQNQAENAKAKFKGNFFIISLFKILGIILIKK